MNVKLNEHNFLESMRIAIKYQARMKIPKYFFVSVGIICCIATLQKIFTGNSLIDNDLVFLLYTIYWSCGGILSIFYILLAGICPYCHHFQINNSKSYGISDDKVIRFKGISPFIDYCVYCNAPLSKKAVIKHYEGSVD